MHRTIAGIAATLLTALAIGAPFATPAHAGPTSLQCASGGPAECALLDDLAAQLGPIAPLLGTGLAPLASEAQALAARSDSAQGVPTAEVIEVSNALLGGLSNLPAPVQTLVGAAGLGEATSTLQALVAGLTAPAAGGQQSSGGSAPTPAQASTSSSPFAPIGGARSAASSSPTGAASTGGPTSSDQVPAVPVGDPLTLAPLALPELGFDSSFEPVITTDAAAPSAEDVKMAAVADALGGDSKAAELVVVAVMSVLLLAAAGIAQVQATRHQIPG